MRGWIGGISVGKGYDRGKRKKTGMLDKVYSIPSGN